MALGMAQPAWLRHANGTIGKLRIVNIERAQDRTHAYSQARFTHAQSCGVRQRRAQQHDAKVGIRRYHCARGLDRAQDALSDINHGRGDFRGHCMRTQDEIPGMHAMSG